MNKKTLILIVLLALLASFFLGLKLWWKPEQELSVVNFFPENQTQDISTAGLKITVDFNRPLKDRQEINFLINPSVEDVSLNLENNQQTLSVTSQEPLQPETNYSFAITDKKDQILIQAGFQTEPLQGNPGPIYQEEKYVKSNFPLLEFTPYKTETFSVYYINPLTLQVSISQGEQREIEKEVKDWIKSKGVDPETHKIEFIPAL